MTCGDEWIMTEEKWSVDIFDNGANKWRMRNFRPLPRCEIFAILGC